MTIESLPLKWAEIVLAAKAGYVTEYFFNPAHFTPTDGDGSWWKDTEIVIYQNEYLRVTAGRSGGGQLHSIKRVSILDTAHFGHVLESFAAAAAVVLPWLMAESNEPARAITHDLLLSKQRAVKVEQRLRSSEGRLRAARRK